MTIRDELVDDTTATVACLNEKVREAVTMGKPTEAVDYACALQSAAGALDYLDHPDPDDD